MVVYCFDRDMTIDCSMGPVPLEWVKRLAEDHPVYAIGNQTLCQEADIPGIGPEDAPSHVGESARVRRLKAVEAKHPGQAYIHVDDVDVGADGWERWTYFSPQGFVDAVEHGEVEF